MKRILLSMAIAAGIGLQAQADTALFYANDYDISDLTADFSIAFTNHNLPDGTGVTITDTDFKAGEVTV